MGESRKLGRSRGLWWLGLALLLVVLVLSMGLCGDGDEASRVVEEPEEEAPMDPEPVDDRGQDAAVMGEPAPETPRMDVQERDTQEDELLGEDVNVDSEEEVDEEVDEEGADIDEERAREERRERILEQARQRGMEVEGRASPDEEEEASHQEGEEGDEASGEAVTEEGAWQEWADGEGLENDEELRRDERVQEALDDLEEEVLRREEGEGGDPWEAEDIEAREVAAEALDNYQGYLDEAWQMDEGSGLASVAMTGLAESLYLLSATTGIPRTQATAQRERVRTGSRPETSQPVGEAVEDPVEEESAPEEALEELPETPEELGEVEWDVWLEATEWLGRIQEENYPHLEDWMVDIEEAASRIDEALELDEQVDALMIYFEAVESLLEAMAEEDVDGGGAAS